MDGTGKCRRIDSGESLTCVMIPGGIIACKDLFKAKYECVQYGAVAANQTQFVCEPDADGSVQDSLFESSNKEQKLDLSDLSPDGSAHQDVVTQSREHSSGTAVSDVPPSPVQSRAVDNDNPFLMQPPNQQFVEINPANRPSFDGSF